VYHQVSRYLLLPTYHLAHVARTILCSWAGGQPFSYCLTVSSYGILCGHTLHVELEPCFKSLSRLFYDIGYSSMLQAKL